MPLFHPKGRLHSPLGSPLLIWQQYPVRVTWRFLIRAAAYAALTTANAVPSNAGSFAQHRRCFAEHFRSVCRNVSGKLPSHAFAGLTALSRRATACAVGKRHRIIYRAIH